MSTPRKRELSDQDDHRVRSPPKKKRPADLDEEFGWRTYICRELEPTITARGVFLKIRASEVDVVSVVRYSEFCGGRDTATILVTVKETDGIIPILNSSGFPSCPANSQEKEMRFLEAKGKQRFSSWDMKPRPDPCHITNKYAGRID